MIGFEFDPARQAEDTLLGKVAMIGFDAVNIRQEVGTVLDPLERAGAADAASARRTAPRGGTMDGQTLAVIDNRTNPRFRERLVQRLQAEYQLDDVILVVKDTVNVPPRPEDWQEVVKRGTVGLALYGA
jgi:hypothetical protein